MVFRDTEEAGRLLGKYLLENKIQRDETIVLGILRVGAIVAKHVCEVYMDKQTINYFNLSQKSIHEIKNLEFQRLKETQRKFSLDGISDFLSNNVLLGDDGIATAYTMIAGVNFLLRKGVKKVTVAVPVCPSSSLSKLKPHAHEVYCYHVVEKGPYAVGMFYLEFSQLNDYDIQEILTG